MRRLHWQASPALRAVAISIPGCSAIWVLGPAIPRLVAPAFTSTARVSGARSGIPAAFAGSLSIRTMPRHTWRSINARPVAAPTAPAPMIPTSFRIPPQLVLCAFNFEVRKATVSLGPSVGKSFVYLLARADVRQILPVDSQHLLRWDTSAA